MSAHGNRLTTLPAEIDHIKNLAVINLTANMIQHLPVSLMKLHNITAIWLSENQHKPLVQLNQDTDPETGQRVLTNFLLPQHNQVLIHCYSFINSTIYQNSLDWDVIYASDCVSWVLWQPCFFRGGFWNPCNLYNFTTIVMQ